jgi:hypothetical protein
MKYYIVRNGEPFGPLEKQDLLSYGTTRESDIWHEGLPQWVKASTIPELADLFEESAFGAYTEVGQAGAFPPPPRPAQPEFIPHTNWLPWAVLATVLGFMSSCIGMVFGIVAIVQANKANRYYAEGVQIAGDSANSTAKTMTIIGLVIAVIGLLYSIYLVSTGDFTQLIEILDKLD